MSWSTARPKIAVETEQTQICITGVEHGKRYHFKVRSGLPSADNEHLAKDVDLDIYVADRSPFVGFANNAYVLPAGLGGGLPITSVNAKTADVVIYRIGDRSIATAVRNGVFQGNLTGYSAQDVANKSTASRPGPAKVGPRRRRQQRHGDHRHPDQGRAAQHRAGRLCGHRPRQGRVQEPGRLATISRRSGSSLPTSG